MPLLCPFNFLTSHTLASASPTPSFSLPISWHPCIFAPPPLGTPPWDSCNWLLRYSTFNTQLSRLKVWIHTWEKACSIWFSGHRLPYSVHFYSSINFLRISCILTAEYIPLCTYVHIFHCAFVSWWSSGLIPVPRYCELSIPQYVYPY